MKRRHGHLQQWGCVGSFGAIDRHVLLRQSPTGQLADLTAPAARKFPNVQEARMLLTLSTFPLKVPSRHTYTTD